MNKLQHFPAFDSSFLTGFASVKPLDVFTRGEYEADVSHIDRQMTNRQKRTFLQVPRAPVANNVDECFLVGSKLGLAGGEEVL